MMFQDVAYTHIRIGPLVAYELPDRVAGRPFIGFVVGTGVSLLLWVLIGAGLWALLV